MDRNPADSLNPELKATYDRIMGVSAQVPTPQTRTPAQQVTTTNIPPSPNPVSEENRQSQPRKISAFQPPQIHTTIDAIGVFETPIRTPRHLVVKVLVVIAFLCLLGYVLDLLKITDLPLPF